MQLWTLLCQLNPTRKLVTLIETGSHKIGPGKNQNLIFGLFWLHVTGNSTQATSTWKLPTHSLIPHSLRLKMRSTLVFSLASSVVSAVLARQ